MVYACMVLKINVLFLFQYNYIGYTYYYMEHLFYITLLFFIDFIVVTSILRLQFCIQNKSFKNF